MAVQLRERKIKNGVSLYWDFYISGNRFTQTSKYRLYDDEPKSRRKKKRDHAMREGYLMEMNFLTNGIDKVKAMEAKGEASFTLYMCDIRDTRKTESTRGNWATAVKHFKNFAGETKFKQLSEEFCQSYLDYLRSFGHAELEERIANAKSKIEVNELKQIRGLSNMSIRSYYMKFMSAVKEAHKSGLINDDYTIGVVGVPKDDRQDKIKHTVTMTELRSLMDHKCKYESFEQVRKAFVFTCMTGLRISDCRAIKWGDIWEIENPHGEEKVCVIRITQKKTKRVLNIPIFESTLAIAGERGSDDEPLFALSKHACCFNRSLQKVFRDAKLDSLLKKNITSHSGRHTFAVITRNNGVDMGILKELLGHRDMKSTEHYGRLSTSSLIGALYQRPTL